MLRTYNTARDNSFSKDFLVVVIDQYFLLVHMQRKTYKAFTCVNSLLFLLPLIIFIVLLSFSMNFKPNFGFNFNTISLFSLGFLPVKEKSLGFLELTSKM